MVMGITQHPRLQTPVLSCASPELTRCWKLLCSTCDFVYLGVSFNVHGAMAEIYHIRSCGWSENQSEESQTCHFLEYSSHIFKFWELSVAELPTTSPSTYCPPLSQTAWFQ